MGNVSTRDLILDEARQCFAEQGFVGTSLNDIAAGVGIRRPSLLHYFDSKEQLYRQVLTTALADWAVRVNTAVSAPLEGWALVDNGLLASYEFFSSNPEVIKIFGREAINPKTFDEATISSVLKPYFQRAVSFLNTEMDAGRLRRHDAENLIVTGYGALLTYFSDSNLLEHLIGSDPLTSDALEQRYHHLREFFRAALEP